MSPVPLVLGRLVLVLRFREDIVLWLMSSAVVILFVTGTG